MPFTTSKFGTNPTARLSVTGAGESSPLLVPTECSVVSIGVIPEAGASGRVEYTLSPPDMVEAGTATWRAWPHGDVTVSTDDALATPVTAIRLAVVSGTVVLEAVGN